VSKMTREYKHAYNKAKQELLERLKKRDQLDQEIRKLKQSAKTLAELTGADPEEVDKLLLTEGFGLDPRLGFTDAIRRLLRIHREALHPIEIRDDLLKMGIGRDQVNLLSSIHTVLRRLVAAGEIEKTADSRFRLAV
jgi:transposase